MIETMKTPIRRLFALSDFCAWTLVLFGVAAAVIAPIALPVVRRMDHLQTSGLQITAAVVMGLVTAVVGWLLVRRRLAGLVSAFVLLLPQVLSGAWGLRWIALVLLLVFVLPHALVAWQAWRLGRTGRPIER